MARTLRTLFTCAAIGSGSLAFSAENPIVFETNYMKFSVNWLGTLGMYPSSNAKPGLQHDPTGTGTFFDNADYLTPGSPWEGWYLKADQFGGSNLEIWEPSVTGNNNGDSPKILGTLSNLSGQPYAGSTWDYRAVWSSNGDIQGGGTNSRFSIVHDYALGPDDQFIKITTTVTAHDNLSNLQFLRVLDPDQDSAPGYGSSSTENTRGLDGVPGNDIVCAKSHTPHQDTGIVRDLRVCLYSNSSTQHNTSVSSWWSIDPTYYLDAGDDTGGNIRGDDTIGIAFNLGNLTAGQSVSFVYYYLFAADLSILLDLIQQTGGSASRFVDIAAARGYGDIANFIAANPGALAELESQLNLLTGATLDRALKTAVPTEQATMSHAVQLGAFTGGAAMLFDRAGTFMGDFTAPSQTLTSYRLTPEWAPVITSDTSFYDMAVRLSGDPIRLGSVATAAPGLNGKAYRLYQPGEWGGWVQGFGNWGRGSETLDGIGYSTETYGILGAVENALSDSLMMGVMLGYYEGQVRLNDSAGKSDSKSTQVTLYGQKILGSMKLSGSVGLGVSRFDGERNIQVGLVTETARSSYDGRLAAATFGASYLFERGRWDIEPFTQVAYVASKTDAYTETGAGALNQTVGGDTVELGMLRAGVVFKHDIQVRDWEGHFKVKPSVRVQTELNDAANTVAFVSGGSAVNISGRDMNTIAGNLGLEAALKLKESTRVRAGYDYTYESDFKQHQVFLHFERKF